MIYDVKLQSLGVLGLNSQRINPKLFPVMIPTSGNILKTFDGS